MPTTMTTDQLAARTSRALNAAVTAGRELGLAVSEPTVLHDVFSVVVHLAPSPVVVRVPTVVPEYLDLDGQATRQRIELDVVAWLVEQDAPVIPPSPLVPREPVRRNGFSMTFWQFVELDSSEPDYVHNSG
ncbi:aminoglycoside phosphotransferase family protein, partial [Nocardia gipuzkoensis]